MDPFSDRAMAAKPSTAAEKALQKIQDQVTCGICLQPYKQPKLLKCFHVFCEQCLQYLVRWEQEGESLLCPQCRQVTSLPEDGVPGLQGAFYIHYLFDIQDALQKVSSTDQLMCSTCYKREAIHFCRTCRFVCEICEEQHLYRDSLRAHEIIDFSTMSTEGNALIPSTKKALFCFRHQEVKADLYCETCDELICRDCTVRVHRDHQYDLVPESFAKQEKVIVDSLKPVGEQIAALETVVESVDSRCAAVEEQKTAVVAEIHTAMAHLRQALELREIELVGQAEQTAQQKLKTLAAQRDRFELQLGQLRRCQDFVEESRRTCSPGEILRMKSPLMKQVNDLTSSFKPETLALAEQADVRFAHSLSLPELVKTCQQFGKVYCHPVVPEKCQASGEGIKVATRGKTVAVSVEIFDKQGKPCLRRVDSLMCELVASDGSSRVRGTVKRRNQNIYDISYQPQVTGEHQLHIQTEQQPILNGPFTVTVLPNLTAPASIIGGLKQPRSVAVKVGGEMVVAEQDSNCVSTIKENRRKILFGGSGSEPLQSCDPAGVAIDSDGNVVLADLGNNSIQWLSSTGKSLKTVGTKGSEPLQFQSPVDIAIDPLIHWIYVADKENHRIQFLRSDFTFFSSFGGKGSNNGEFNYPHAVSIDRERNVYVADSYNHRIQVFTPTGLYLRQFGKEGSGRGELKQPVGIAIDLRNIVYVSEYGNNRISIFSTSGKFIESFGEKGEDPLKFHWPYGLAVDENGKLYVCDTGNDRLQIFG